jgi:ATP-dependent helicase/nuclease subunit A
MPKEGRKRPTATAPPERTRIPMSREHEKQPFGLAEGINTAVIAGAGTGKTTRLIGEIIALIERRGVPMERVLAVTFSESAAADMKEKLRDKLEARFAETNDSRFLTAVSSLPRAQISTVHSLARRILVENPFEAGIDPGFTIQEESSDVLLTDEIWRLWAKQVFWGGTEFDDDLIMILGHMSVEGLKKVALTLASRPDRIADYAAYRVDPRQEQERLETRLNEIRGPISSVLAPTTITDPLLDRLVAVRDILSGRDLTEIDGKFRDARIIKRGGAKSRWEDKDLFDTVKQLIDGPGGAIDTLKEVGTFLDRLEQDAVVRAVIRVLSDFASFFRAEKRRRGILSFFDLIWEAKLLLEHDRSIRRRYQNEFDYILVDEFQDIDPILGDIILLLAEDGQISQRPHEVRLRPGKLFIVGDPKQSIYRFREADIGVFFSVMKKIEESGGRTDTLETNYRSQRHLIAFQNAFFEEFIRHEDDRYTIQYDALDAAVSDAAAADRAPAVRIVDSDPGASMSAEGIRRAEADYIAEEIQALVEGKVEGRIVRNSRGVGPGQHRDIEYRDIAVLFRSLSGVSSLYEEALKRTGIPYFIVGGRGYFQRQEIYDVANILRAVFKPTDRRSLVGALRSPAFGIDDLTLYNAARQGELSYPADQREGPVGGALGVLRRLHTAAFRLSLSDLIREIYRTIPIVEVNAFGPGGAQRVGNLIKIKETARALESKGPLTLPAFLKLLTALSLEREDEAEAVVTEEGKNAVRIMTIHAAKGLEFPVVFVVDLGRKKRPWDREGIFIDRSDTPVSGARLGPVADFGYRNAIRAREDRRAAAEERRLLYVAATRARDRLILLGSGKEEASHQRALMEFVGSSGGGDPEPAVLQRIERKDDGKYSVGKRPAHIGDLFDGPIDQTPRDCAREAEVRRRTEYEQAIKRKSFSFVTLGKDEEPAAAVSYSAADPDGIGRHVGNLVHEVLSIIDLSGDERPDGLIERAAAGMGLPPDIAGDVIAAARTLIDGFLVSDLCREIASSRIIGREIPLLTKRDDVTLTGRIDIVYETVKGIVVLDYKTDSVTKQGAAEAALRYKGQIAAYVEALTKAVKSDIIIAGGVYFIRPGVLVHL